MQKHRIIVERLDKCLAEIMIISKQPEGNYEYIPVKGDKLKVRIKDKKDTVVKTYEITVSEDLSDRMSMDIPTDLEAGEYTYDISITYADSDERHTVCDDNILIIKEDEGHA